MNLILKLQMLACDSTEEQKSGIHHSYISVKCEPKSKKNKDKMSIKDEEKIQESIKDQIKKIKINDESNREESELKNSFVSVGCKK